MNEGTVRDALASARRAGGQFSTFVVGDLFFGIDVLEVQEVLLRQEMTSVPLAPGVIEGLINLRGHIVTAIDMRRRLGLPERSTTVPPMNVVVRTDDGTVSLLVDEIEDVLTLAAEAWEEPPVNLEPGIRQFVDGVYKVSGRLLLALDAGRAAHLNLLREG